MLFPHKNILFKLFFSIFDFFFIFYFYSQTAEFLMQESGCRLDHPAAAKFRQHVMDGDWNKADSDLTELKSLLDPSSNNFEHQSGNLYEEMKFLLLEQKYLEYLEDGRVGFSEKKKNFFYS